MKALSAGMVMFIALIGLGINTVVGIADFVFTIYGVFVSGILGILSAIMCIAFDAFIFKDVTSYKLRSGNEKTVLIILNILNFLILGFYFYTELIVTYYGTVLDSSTLLHGFMLFYPYIMWSQTLLNSTGVFGMSIERNIAVKGMEAKGYKRVAGFAFWMILSWIILFADCC